MKLRTVITTATTAAVLASSGVALAGASGNAVPSSPPAQSSTPVASTAPVRAEPGTPHARARCGPLRRLLRGARDVLTDTIGIDRATLRRGLGSGQTIAQIASANNVEPQAVIDALITAATSKLDAAVAAGRITAERAAKIEARLPARITKLVNEWHPRRAREALAS